MANPEAGRRFEEYVRIALAKSKSVHNPAELIRATGLHPNTLYDLFNGATETPGSRTMARIATALDVPIADLWAVWEGRALEPPPLIEVLRDLAPDLHELVLLLRAQADEALVESLRLFLEERHRQPGGDDAAPPDSEPTEDQDASS